MDVDGKPELLIKGVKISPRINFGDHCINSSFYINDTYIGRIQEVIDFTSIKVAVNEYEVEAEEGEDISSDRPSNEPNLLDILKGTAKEVSIGKSGSKPRQRKKKIQTKMVTPFNLPKGEVILTVQDDYAFNDMYKYGRGSYASGYGAFDEYDF